MITPIIIQVLFWIGTVLCVILGIKAIDEGTSSRFGGGGGEEVLAGVLFLILGPLIVRIYCELLILFFRMNETLTEIKRNTDPKRGTASV
jgi:hypothetical protein